MIKKIFVILLILSLNSSEAVSQVKNCTITIIDSTNIQRNYKFISLESFYSDTLIFSDNLKLYKTDVNKITSLSYMSEIKPLTGFIIGGAIGLAACVVLLLEFGNGIGHPGSGSPTHFGAALGGTILITVLGAVIGGIVQKSQMRREKVIFSELSDAEKKIKLRSIFESYDEKNK